MNGGRPRAVVVVPNTVAPYSRGLRLARTLAGQGYAVEIAAMMGSDLPREERDGEVTIRRYGDVADASGVGTGERPRPRRGRAAPMGRLAGLLVRALRWPAQARPWAAALGAQLAPADLYHACGYLAIGPCLELAAAAGRTGRRGRVIYDVIDVVLDSNLYLRFPRPLLWLYRRRERAWARGADAVVTVNAPLAEHLGRSWRLPVPPTVLLNTPPRWSPPPVPADRIRQATGIPAERRIVLFVGRAVREKGLEEAAEAVLGLEDAALVVIGFGLLVDDVRARDRDARFSGRHYTLPPVHPDELPAWVASADVSFVAMPGHSLNQRLSSPNKFWESITAGTPVVVGRDLSFMRTIVEAERLGAVADPEDPRDLARAFRSILDLSPHERDRMRQRCLEAARTRYNWETTVIPYVSLVRTLR